MDERDEVLNQIELENSAPVAAENAIEEIVEEAVISEDTPKTEIMENTEEAVNEITFTNDEVISEEATIKEVITKEVSIEGDTDEKTLEESDTEEGFNKSDDTEEVSTEEQSEESTEEGGEESAEEEMLADVDKAFVVDNVDDSQLLADEVGVSNIFDTYGREVLEPVFENILRLSKNTIKLTYSRLKNTILGYKEVKQRYSGAYELFKKSNKILCRIEIVDDIINLYLALNPDRLNAESFIFDSAKGLYKQTPTKVTISKCDEKSGEAYLSAVGLIEKVMEENGIEKSKTYVPTAYAERYPFNPDAVLKGKEETPPSEDAYTDIEYDYIEGELTKNIIEELMGKEFGLENKRGKDKLNALRQQAGTIKGAVAIAEPIIYFYDSALNLDNQNEYINVQQVLQDKFLGKILPQQYFAIAESSARIEQLNYLAVKEAVINCNDNPKFYFCVKVSCRLLTKGAAFERLLKYSKTENNNLIMAFDCALLEVLGQDGMAAIEKLKENGVKIMLDNTESAGLKILTEYVIDYLRFDARYYKEENLRTTAHLDMLTGYCKVQGIKTTSINVETSKEAKHLAIHGVGIIQGFVIGEPKRTIAAAVKEIRKLAIVV